jgi:hypothetical protein
VLATTPHRISFPAKREQCLALIKMYYINLYISYFIILNMSHVGVVDTSIGLRVGKNWYQIPGEVKDSSLLQKSSTDSEI